MMTSIPLEFIKHKKDVLRNDLEYTVMYDDDDREEWMKLAAKVDALDELIRDWEKYGSKNI